MKDEHQHVKNHDIQTTVSKLFEMPISRRSMLAATAAVIFSPTLSFAQGASTSPKARGGQIIVGITQEPTVFHPLMPGVEADQGIWFALFNPLWHVEPDGSFIPDLAEEVPSLENGGISEDGHLWKVKLRQGVKWHDGTDFTAEDVKFTLELINNPKFRAATRQGHGLVHDIQTSGKYEISWRMKKAYAPYLAMLSWTFIVPKHVLADAADPNATSFNSAPIGTGPFKWGKRVAGQGVTVEANPNYFGEGPYVKRVIWNYVPDSNVLYTQFKTGQLDYVSYTGLLAHYYKEAKQLPDRTIIQAPGGHVEAIVMNFGKPIFADKAVRQALYAGINKQAIIDAIYYGLPKPTESFLSESSWAYNTNLPKQKFDWDLGNKILDDAGWVLGKDGVREKSGMRLEFVAATQSGNAQREQVLQVLQQSWKKLGIAMSIKTMPAAVVYGDYYNKSQFDCLLLASIYGTGSDPDPTQRFSSAAIPIQGGAGQNFYQYKNPDVDRLLQIAQTSFDRNVRKDTYLKIQELIREDLAILPICQPSPVEGTKAKLIGHQTNANVRSNCWNMANWYWKD